MAKRKQPILWRVQGGGGISIGKVFLWGQQRWYSREWRWHTGPEMSNCQDHQGARENREWLDILVPGSEDKPQRWPGTPSQRKRWTAQLVNQYNIQCKCNHQSWVSKKPQVKLPHASAFNKIWMPAIRAGAGSRRNEQEVEDVRRWIRLITIWGRGITKCGNS